MSDQTYSPVIVPPPNASQTLNTTEPDQVTGVPTSATEVKKTDITTEVGGTGTTIVGGFLTGQDYNPDFTGTRRINLFDEMRLSDATVRAGLNMVKLPILSADWYIKDPSGDSELGEPAAFADRQLFKNPNFTWTAFLRQALTMCDNGNSVFEKVFELLPDGKIGWKKLAPRMSKTIYRWTLNDGVYPGNVKNVRLSKDGTRLVNALTARGQGYGDEQLTVQVSDMDSQQLYAIREATVDYSDVFDEAQLTNLANSELSTYKQPLVIHDVTFNSGVPGAPEVGSFHIGDQIPIYVKTLRLYEDVDKYFTIDTIAVTISGEDEEEVTLTFTGAN